MRRRRILILGDSHTHALRLARKEQESRETTVEITAYRFSKMKNGKEIGDLSVQAALELIATLSPCDILVSTIGGNQHQSFGLVQHPQSFDFLVPGVDTASFAEDTECIPYNILWEYFENGMRGKDGTRLQQLRSASPCPVYHLAPPPPKEDETHILRRHETDFAKRGIVDKGISPAPLRLKIWELQIEVIRRLCAEWDIRFVPVPQQAQTPEGFLKPVYYAEDATHANAAYGKLVVGQLERIALDGGKDFIPKGVLADVEGRRA